MVELYMKLPWNTPRFGLPVLHACPYVRSVGLSHGFHSTTLEDVHQVLTQGAQGMQ